MGPGGFGGPGGLGGRFNYDKIPPPKSLFDIPRFLKSLVGGFFTRLLYTFRLVWNTGKWITFLMVFVALFEGIMPIVGALISKEILNQLQDIVISQANGGNFADSFFGSTVLFLLIFFFVYKILNQVVNRISIAVTRISGEKVVRYVKMQMMNKAMEIDIASFDLPDFYEKLENANREAGSRPISVIASTFDVISKLISLVSYIIILTSAPGLWWISFVMLVVSVPSAIINFKYRRKNFLYMRFRSKERRKMSYYSDVMVNKDMAKEVRMYGLGSYFTEKYNTVFGEYYAGLKKLILRENALQIVISVIAAVVNCFFFALIAFQVFLGNIKIGDYTLYTGALTSIATTVTGLIGVSATVYEGTLFIDNLISFMNEKPTVVPKNIKKPARIEHGKPHTVEFVGVSFCYPGTTRKVIDNINVRFNPGETVVLVGLNGAGKTTFIKLLTRLYDPTEGHILLDGIDLREYEVSDLYKMFGIIFQDYGKYAFTVAENIKFGDIDSETDMEKIKTAAHHANADEYISRLPNGFDTPLMRIFESDGTELSIGQWQKIAIARAFYSESDILILDEPTASLDPIAEQEIFNQFDKLRQGKTTVFVSHRLSSATVASKILVLDYGKVIEEGNHRELMAKQGHYYELFSTQAKRYLDNSGSKDQIRDEMSEKHEKTSKKSNGSAEKNGVFDIDDSIHDISF